MNTEVSRLKVKVHFSRKHTVPKGCADTDAASPFSKYHPPPI